MIFDYTTDQEINVIIHEFLKQDLFYSISHKSRISQLIQWDFTGNSVKAFSQKNENVAILQGPKVQSNRFCLDYELG